MQFIEDDPSSEVRIDLEGSSVFYGDFSFQIAQPKSSRIVLIQGRWDTLSELKEAENETRKVAESLPYLKNFKN